MAYVPRSQRKETEIQELFKELHEITEKQDIINLKIRELINDSKDPRWLPIHIIDNANALILEISLHEGGMGNWAYIDEKADGLWAKLFQQRQQDSQTL
ncbi:hypothetical protein D4R42_04125 [bacterium]|nr:MAG: hypothetical protein D4R42_04125 [bacterium]HUX79634.1 hypothetical protein [Alphaproteobacteria bacterium]